MRREQTGTSRRTFLPSPQKYCHIPASNQVIYREHICYVPDMYAIVDLWSLVWADASAVAAAAAVATAVRRRLGEMVRS